MIKNKPKQLIKKENEKLENAKIKVKVFDFKYNEGILIILKDENIDEVFILKAVSEYLIDIYKDKTKIESGLLIECFAIWIYNLYNPVKFLYEFVGGIFNGKTMTKEEIDKIAIGKTEDMEEYRKKGLTVHRKKLDNQPIVKGYLSPIFNGINYGIIHLRYETQEIYNMISR